VKNHLSTECLNKGGEKSYYIDMKMFLFLLLAIACLLLCPLAYSADYGDTKAQVVAEHGEPLNRRFMAEGRELWQYPRGQITLMNGRVIKIIMAGEDSVRPPVPSVVVDDAPKTSDSKDGAEAPVVPTVSAEGLKLAKELRSSVDFLVAPPERQMETKPLSRRGCERPGAQRRTRATQARGAGTPNASGRPTSRSR